MAVTMKDVALRAGISFSTVSHVINGTRHVSDELRSKVLQAMEELAFTPNQLARGLRSGRTDMIGMIIPDTTNLFYGRVAHRIESACSSQGYTVVFCNSDGDQEKERLYTTKLIERHVSGIIFIPGGNSIGHIDVIRSHKIPVVIADRRVHEPDLDTVVSDNEGGAGLATRHLIDLGHTRIACVTGSPRLISTADRLAGYRQAVIDSGLCADESLIVSGDDEFEGGYRRGRELLSLASPPTAVFACNDLMAIGVMRAAYELGVSVPRDLSVVGFGNVNASRYCVPPLTTIHQSKEQMGNDAVEMLIERIGNPGLAARKKILKTDLRIRRSTGKRGQ